MNINYINKISCRIFGLPIFERVEIHSGKEGEDDIAPINIIVKKDYYDSEFDINKNDDEKKEK